MPAIKIDTSELGEVLRLTPADQNVMLVGRHGIGKSQIVAAHFENEGREVVTFFLGQMSDPGDLIGLMHKNPETGHSEFLPPYWWPLEDKPVVLFLDELNRARPEILQSVMDLTLNRTLAGKSLPKGSQVIAAVNEGEEYQLTDLDPALVSRFNIYQFSPTVEDWLLWANDNGIDARVVSFVQNNSEYLDGDPRAASSDPNTFTAELTRTPDRRSWERVSGIIDGISDVTELHVKLIAGLIGVSAARVFVNDLKNSAAIAADDVLLRFGKTKAKLKKLQTHELAGLNERLILRIQKGGYDAAAKKKVLKNFAAYVDLMLEGEHSESCAHLASMLERPRFESASEFLLGNAEILARMVDFVGAISIDD